MVLEEVSVAYVDEELHLPGFLGITILVVESACHPCSNIPKTCIQHTNEEISKKLLQFSFTRSTICQRYYWYGRSDKCRLPYNVYFSRKVDYR